MAIQDQTTARRTVVVDTFTDGLLGPDVAMAGPVADGGHIVWNSTPGCWGPMITPAIRGGHEVCTPVYVEGAEVGDAIAIRIKDIAVTSQATSSGNDQAMEGRFNGDPYCAAVCPGCGAEWPETRVDGIGETAIRCVACGADATPFTFTNGYTVAFDGQLGIDRRRGPRAGLRPRRPGGRGAARQLGPEPDPHLRPARHRRPRHPHAALPRPARHDALDDAARLAQRGRLRRVPRRRAAQVRARRPVAAAAQDRRPPGHRRRARRRDARSARSRSRAAASTSATCTRCRATARSPATPPTSPGPSRCRSRSSRASGIDGPVLFPLAEDLPFLAKPLTAAELARASALAAREGVGAIEESLPVSVIGTGPDLNSATDNGLARAAELLGISVPEVMNRATIAGAIEIGRAPGVVQVTFRAPAAALGRTSPLRRGAVCLNETGSHRERRAGSIWRRPTSTPPRTSTASCSAGRRSRPARSRRPAATSSSCPTGAGSRASAR